MLVEAAVAPVVNGGIRMNANILFHELINFMPVQLATELLVRPATITQVLIWSRITKLSNCRYCHYPGRNSIG